MSDTKLASPVAVAGTTGARAGASPPPPPAAASASPIKAASPKAPAAPAATAASADLTPAVGASSTPAPAIEPVLRQRTAPRAADASPKGDEVQEADRELVGSTLAFAIAGVVVLFLAFVYTGIMSG
jgi:hypothetical protein